jgi:hypothetical protein
MRFVRAEDRSLNVVLRSQTGDAAGRAGPGKAFTPSLIKKKGNK